METLQVAGQILLADADPAICDYMTALLEGWQFHIVCVATAAEVETRCATEYFDLVLLDFMGGEREGVGVVERMAAIPNSPPVVPFTESQNWKDVSTILEGKVGGFLPK